MAKTKTVTAKKATTKKTATKKATVKKVVKKFACSVKYFASNYDVINILRL